MTWVPGDVWPSTQFEPTTASLIQAALSPAQTMALTAWAEARSRLVKGQGWKTNPLDALADILNVVMNRVADGRPRWAKLGGPKGICLEPYAFSCWLPHVGADSNHDPQHLADNFEALMDRAQRLLAGEQSDKVSDCVALAEGAIAGQLLDSLSQATHYYADSIIAPTWALPPAEFVVSRYGHRFFRSVK